MKVPNVLGMPLEQARSTLKGTPLAWRVTESPGVPVGSVIAQNPRAGTLMAAGAIINLNVAVGVLVPNVVGMPLDQAMSKLQEIQFTWRVAEQPGVRLGTVMTQDPPGGAHVAVGTTVNLVVAGQVLVPNVVGMPPNQARASLERERLRVVVTGWPEVLLVTVLAQTPRAGTLVAADTLVSLTAGIEAWRQAASAALLVVVASYVASKLGRRPPPPKHVMRVRFDQNLEGGRIEVGTARQQGPEVRLRSVSDLGSQNIDTPEDLLNTDERSEP